MQALYNLLTEHGTAPPATRDGAGHLNGAGPWLVEVQPQDRAGRGRWYRRDPATGQSAGYTDQLDRAGLFTADELDRQHLLRRPDPDGVIVAVDALVLVGPATRLLARLVQLDRCTDGDDSDLGRMTHPDDGTAQVQLGQYRQLADASESLRTLQWDAINVRRMFLHRDRSGLSNAPESLQGLVDAAMRWVVDLELQRPIAVKVDAEAMRREIRAAVDARLQAVLATSLDVVGMLREYQQLRRQSCLPVLPGLQQLLDDAELWPADVANALSALDEQAGDRPDVLALVPRHTFRLRTGTDGAALGCDCYGGCWGDHSARWPALVFDDEAMARLAYRLAHQHHDGRQRTADDRDLQRGQYVLQGRELRICTLDLLRRHAEYLLLQVATTTTTPQ